MNNPDQDSDTLDRVIDYFMTRPARAVHTEPAFDELRVPATAEELERWYRGGDEPGECDPA